MNDHDAMTAINVTLDQWLKGDISELLALTKIVQIAASYAIEHEAAK